jgi:hypothetical protein
VRRIEYVWVASKPGVQRRHTSPDPFTPTFADVLKDQGYVIRRLEYEVDDEADLVLRTAAASPSD